MISYWEKQNAKAIFKALAKAKGMSVKEVKQEIAWHIEEIQNGDDEFQHELFKKLFGRKTPSPEEYITKIGNYAAKL